MTMNVRNNTYTPSTTYTGGTAQLRESGTGNARNGMPRGTEQGTVIEYTEDMLGSGLPALAMPTASPSPGVFLGALSLEALMSVVQSQQRDTECESAQNSIEANAQQREIANKKQVDEIQKQLDSRPKGFMKILSKIFGVIGKLIGLVSAAATALVCPAIGAAAVLFALDGLADWITREATDGKQGATLGCLVSFICKEAGADKDSLGWIQTGVDLGTTIAFSVVTTVCMVGQAMKMGSSTLETVAKGLTVGTGIAGGVCSVGESSIGIVQADNNYKVSKSKARQKDLDAKLQMLNALDDQITDHLQSVIERTSFLMTTISDMVNSHTETNVTLLTGRKAMA